MTKRVASNPKDFVQCAERHGVYYKYLIEAILSINKQSTCRLFNGKSLRGDGSSISSATLENWIETFEFVDKNPKHIDNDQVSGRDINPKQEWFDFVKLIRTKIPDEKVSYWKTCSVAQLSQDAESVGYTVGTKNYNSKKDLRERMLAMAERRRTDVWNLVEVKRTVVDEEDLRLKTILQLKDMAVERGIPTNQLKSDLIDALKKPIAAKVVIDKYMDMGRHDLIQLAKERGLGTYNKLNKPSLVKILSDYDAMSVMEEEERGDRGEGSEEEKRDTKTIATLDWNGIVIQSRESDKYINATQLCKAGGKKYFHYNENDRSKAFLEALSASIGITIGNLTKYNSGTTSTGIPLF